MGDIDKQTDSLIKDQPAIQPHAIEAEQRKETATRSEWATMVDRNGAPFNPDTHVVNSDGSPALTASGLLKRKPGRSKNAPLHKPGQNATAQISSQPGVVLPNYRESATATVEAIGMLGAMIGGDEWAYIKDNANGIDERARGIDVFEQYYRARNVADIPPGVAVAIWGVAYAGSRFMHGPKTKTKLTRIKEWFQYRVLKRRVEKQPEEKPETEKKPKGSIKA